MSTTNQMRLRASRHKRLSEPPPIVLQARDKELVRFVNDYRVLRQEHIEKLLFPSKNTAQKRLWLLWQNGFLKREFLPVLGGIQNSPILYLVDKSGVDLLQTEFHYERQQLRWYTQSPSQMFLRHTLGLADIRVAFTHSGASYNFLLEPWNDEPAMKAQKIRVPVGNSQYPLIPDAHFILKGSHTSYHHFLEFDRGPERLKTFERKLKAYERYFETGMFYTRYKSNNVRVFTVVEGNQTRLDNLRRFVEKSPQRTNFGFATLENVVTSNVFSAPIWYVADEALPVRLV